MHNDNANDVYFTQLTKHSHKRKGREPIFRVADGSNKATRINGDAWNNTMFEMSLDVNNDDITMFKQPLTTPKDLQEHLSFMLAGGNERLKYTVDQRQSEKNWLILVGFVIKQ